MCLFLSQRSLCHGRQDLSGGRPVGEASGPGPLSPQSCDPLALSLWVRGSYDRQRQRQLGPDIMEVTGELMTPWKAGAAV